jgi:hypothetical protein
MKQNNSTNAHCSFTVVLQTKQKKRYLQPSESKPWQNWLFGENKIKSCLLKLALFW